MKSRKEIMAVIEAGLEKHFPSETIMVEEGYGDINIRVKVVSKKFDDMTNKDAAESLWNLIEQTGLTEEEKACISLVLAIGLKEI